MRAGRESVAGESAMDGGDARVTGSAFTAESDFTPWKRGMRTSSVHYTASYDHGARIGLATIFCASSSPTNCCFCGSHCSLRPSLIDVLPRWHIEAERWPISASQIGALRVRTHSKKLPM